MPSIRQTPVGVNVIKKWSEIRKKSKLTEAQRQEDDQLVAILSKLAQLSPPRVIKAEDGSVSFEWITPAWRLAFIIDPAPNEAQSGWVFVSSGVDEHGTVASGRLHNLKFLNSLLTDVLKA
jgi:hypothetical protein